MSIFKSIIQLNLKIEYETMRITITILLFESHTSILTRYRVRACINLRRYIYRRCWTAHFPSSMHGGCKNKMRNARTSIRIITVRGIQQRLLDWMSDADAIDRSTVQRQCEPKFLISHGVRYIYVLLYDILYLCKKVYVIIIYVCIRARGRFTYFSITAARGRQGHIFPDAPKSIGLIF